MSTSAQRNASDCLISYTAILALTAAFVGIDGARAESQTLSAEAAAVYVGTYRQGNIEALIRIEHRGGYLTVLLPGRPPTRLLADGKHEFYPEHLKTARVVFDVVGDRATGYTFNEPGNSQRGIRVNEAIKAGDLTCSARTLTAGNGEHIKAEMCRLAVPENRSKTDSRVIELSFVRLIARAGQAGAPLIFLHGGPGGSASQQAASPAVLTLWSAFLDNRDVILLDQRGCGTSTPKLQFSPDASPAALFGDRETALRNITSAVSSAVEHFRGRGVDLEGYTTTESADDLNDLRKALGVEKINLLGFSYGTHLAQATIRRHGKHLENVVLCGTEGLDMTHKFPLDMDTQFKKLSLMAVQDPEVARYVPDLYELTRRVLDKLDKKPMVVEVFDGNSGNKVPVKVGKFGLQLILRFDVGDATDVIAFPRLLYSIDQGDPSLLRWFVQKRMNMLREVNLVTWVMDGASGASPYRWQRIKAESKLSIFGDVMNFPYPSISEAVGNIDLGAAFREPLVSNVRTLFLSGTLDWNTPPYQAEQVRWGFANGTHLIVDNAGHEQILPQPKIQDAVRRFINGEDVSNVTVNLPPLRFVPIQGTNPKVTHPSISG